MAGARLRSLVWRRFPVAGSRGRAAARRRPGFEALEGRLVLAPVLAGADVFQTQVPVSPASPGADSQYVTALTPNAPPNWQAVSSLPLTVDVNKTGLFDLSFQAVAQSLTGPGRLYL